ncbi:MAG: hypothetical protein RQM90_13660 [Methanoculleus sp.]
MSRVASGVGPAPDMPGTVESMVFARMSATIGRRGLMPGSSERKGSDIGAQGRWCGIEEVAVAAGTTVSRKKSTVRDVEEDAKTQRPKYPRAQTLWLMFEIEHRLEDKGIRRKDIVTAAMELYVSHGIEAEEAADLLDAKIGKALGTRT